VIPAERISPAILALIATWRIPGLTVAICAPEFGLWSQGFGLADVENNVPATDATIYRIASISKPITATAIVQLSERGRLDLDAPIQRYVPSFPEKPWPITSRLLLAHLGGLRDFIGNEGHGTTRHPVGSVPMSAFLEGVKDDPLLHEPGTRFRYSTHGYNLLGAAIESVAGMGYLDYVQQNIFAPAGITEIFAEDTLAILPHRAHGYMGDDDGGIRNADFVDLSDHLPGGGFYATASAVAQFGASLLKGELLGPVALAQMFTRQRTTSGQDTRFGLGWFLMTRHGEIEAAHGGKHVGASTMLYLLAKSGIVVTVLTNLQGVSSPAMHRLTQRIADIIHADFCHAAS